MLKRICLPSFAKDRIRRTELVKTIAGNTVELLMITNFASQQDAIAERKCIIICSRVHPGESNASFIMEGFLEFIVSNEKEANYRTSLSGFDLNRQWVNPDKLLSPEIFAMKQMVKKTLECR